MLGIINAYRDMPRLALLAVLAFLVAIFFAIVLHEMAHGWVAYWNGDHTAKFAGRLSMNPFKHIDPLGFISMILIGFGWAKPVPIDPRNFNNYKKGMITTSLAGVTCNFILACLGAIVLAIYKACTKNIDLAIYVGQLDISAAQYANFFFEYLLIYTMVFNITLMAFNLLPIYPLDGFRVVETLAKPTNRYVNFMYRYGNFVLIGLLLVSTVLGNISPYLDIFGLYIRTIQDLIFKLFNVVLGI